MANRKEVMGSSRGATSSRDTHSKVSPSRADIKAINRANLLFLRVEATLVRITSHSKHRAQWGDLLRNLALIRPRASSRRRVSCAST